MSIDFALYLIKKCDIKRIASTWFIGAEFLRKSALTPIQHPLDTGQWPSVFSNEYNRKPSYHVKDFLFSEFFCS